MKINQKVKVISTGEILVITRIDKHVHPVCAGYRRFKIKDVALLA